MIQTLIVWILGFDASNRITLLLVTVRGCGRSGGCATNDQQ